MSLKRKLERRAKRTLTSLDLRLAMRPGARRRRSPGKAMRNAQRAYGRKLRYARALTGFLLRICGHEAEIVQGPRKLPDAYHQEIATRGTTISQANWRPEIEDQKKIFKAKGLTGSPA